MNYKAKDLLAEYTEPNDEPETILEQEHGLAISLCNGDHVTHRIFYRKDCVEILEVRADGDSKLKAKIPYHYNPTFDPEFDLSEPLKPQSVPLLRRPPKTSGERS